ncbi:MAG TPA: patatin-like phospholipase family protein [Candidatus Kapabacteria bacterium]|nr:patatin-like phospholipase family protein [Candidatus Kapabacteria bacterium]
MAIFRILSLDGGGVRGLLSATLLDQLEQRVPGWLNNVDMVAGTSTGGIIACGLGHGLTPADICRFYYDRMPKIFADSLLDDITDAGGLIGAQYSLKNLRRELKKVFGDTRLGQLRCRVVIPSFDLDQQAPGKHRHWRPRYFHNFPCEHSHPDEKVVDVALRTSAAPTFFPTVDGYVDGGVIANNPAMVALSHALDQSLPLPQRPQLDEIRLLSVGTGLVNTFIPGKTHDWGVGQWADPLFRILFDGLIGVPDYQCQQLLGTHYSRLNYSFPAGRDVALDDWRQRDYLVEVGERRMDAELDQTALWLKNHWLPERPLIPARRRQRARPERQIQQVGIGPMI